MESVLCFFFRCLLVVERNDLLDDFSLFSFEVVNLSIFYKKYFLFVELMMVEVSLK